MTRILVVEDDKNVRENVGELLTAEGFEILQAVDGEEGVQIARREHPDLILCDIRMPRLDGYGVLARLSHDRSTETIPFIFLTARTERADQRIGMNLGADDYITKPFTRRDLVESIRKRLEKQQTLFRQAQETFSVLQNEISRRLPADLLSPLSILLAHAETLAQSPDTALEPGQVRNMARGMRRAANRLLQLVQNYIFYLELDEIALDPIRRANLSFEQYQVNSGEIIELVRGVAREHGREEDLGFEVTGAVLRVSENVYFHLVEELSDLVLRHSHAGDEIFVRGKTLGMQYRLSVIGPDPVDDASTLLNGADSFPLGVMLARRIAEIYGGKLTLTRTEQGGTCIEVDLPRL